MTILLYLSSSFAITYAVTPILIKFAKNAQIYAHDSDRKCHTSPVPSTGGAALFLGILFPTMLLTPNTEFNSIQYLICAQFTIFLLGLKDDIFILSARKKLFFQIICAQIIFLFTSVRIDNFYSILGIQELTYLESNMATTIIFVGLTNAFNLIDGINWLAGLMSISAASFLAYWFTINGFQIESGIASTLIGSVAAFLIFNKTPSRIFMGDAGSLLLGFTISYLLIRFINLNHEAAILTVRFQSAPFIAMSVVFVPILDTTRILITRILQKRSPLTPDQNHLHHILLRKGLSHIQASLTLFLINYSAIATAIILNNTAGKTTITYILLLLYAITILTAFTCLNKKSYQIKL